MPNPVVLQYKSQGLPGIWAQRSCSFLPVCQISPRNEPRVQIISKLSFILIWTSSHDDTHDCDATVMQTPVWLLPVVAGLSTLQTCWAPCHQQDWKVLTMLGVDRGAVDVGRALQSSATK